jgi:multiple sugar transport system ATP-binding protein
VYDRPANVFVARFVGTPPMNLVMGRVTPILVGLAVDLPGWQLPLGASLAHAIAELGTEEVVVGVRPEHLQLADAGLVATVTAIESLGHERHVRCRLLDGQTATVRQRAAVAAPGVGKIVHLVPDLDALHLFDAASALRIDGAPAAPLQVSAAGP